MTNHILLVDASGFAYRAFATSNPAYRDNDGEPIGAILGFMELVWRLLGAAGVDNPTHGAAVFDAPGKTFRHKIYPKYKGNRPAARKSELSKQIPVMQSIADVLSLPPIESPGFEADDVIATMAARAVDAGMRVTIVSSDKDFGQLVRDGLIEIVDPMAKERRLAADVERKFGVPPSLVAHVQALAGDTVDAIPGVPGVGLDRAAALIRRFGSVDQVVKNADKIRWPQVRVQVSRHADQALMCLKLTTLRQDVPIDLKWDDFKMQQIKKAHVEEIATALGAKNKIATILRLDDPKFTMVVDPVEDPFEWWREELAAPGQRLPDVPQCGFYKQKLIRGGPWVAARIWRVPQKDPESGKPTGKDVLHCELGGRPKDPNYGWAGLSMHPISEEQFQYETADARHAEKYRPGDPKATPNRRIDILSAPASVNPKAKRK